MAQATSNTTPTLASTIEQRVGDAADDRILQVLCNRARAEIVEESTNDRVVRVRVRQIRDQAAQLSARILD